MKIENHEFLQRSLYRKIKKKQGIWQVFQKMCKDVQFKKVTKMQFILTCFSYTVFVPVERKTHTIAFFGIFLVCFRSDKAKRLGFLLSLKGVNPPFARKNKVCFHAKCRVSY